MAKQLLFIPGPVTCSSEVLEAMGRPMIDHRGPEFAALLARIARGMQPMFGTSSDVVVLGCSGTGGLEAAVANSFTSGQKILACPVGVFGQRLATIARLHGLDVEMLETPLGARVDADALAARLRADDKRDIAGILLTHNETSTGVQNDMAELSAAIGDHPATVVVDSVSGLGASDFAMDAWRFDIVVTASQKALAVPPGMAMVAISARAWQRMETAGAPRFYFDLRKAREFAALGQTPWTPPVSIAYALDVALEAYHAKGAHDAYARHDRYARAIRGYAEAAGIDLLSRPGAHSVTVVAMRAPQGVDVAKLRAELREEHGVVIGGGQGELKGKIVRIGTMGALSHVDVMRALDTFGTVLQRRGHDEPFHAAAASARAVLDGEFAAAR